jgi:NADPH:quinone reductase-like Zn-dependent oxidoreductase
MAKAVIINKTGGPEVMEYVDVAVGEPGPGEVRIRQEACGLNYIDVYFRDGTYPQPLPGGLGMEGAGVVEAVGSGVTHVKPGDRVAYAGRPTGAYADVRVMPAAPLVKLPDAIGFETAAAMMLQGLTVQYLFRRTFPLKGGETILFHAAAGGVGLIACQWARALGVTMIGTVGSDDDRHGRIGRKGRNREGARLHAHDQLQQGKFRGARQGTDRRQGRAGGLRFDRQGYVHRFARLPVAARHDGQLRERIRTGSALHPE